jgi:prevent-host-death family protein
MMSMTTTSRKGAEEARAQLPRLLDAAEKGHATIITKHGRAVAALVPVDTLGSSEQQHSLVPLKGSGRGLWGKSSALTVRKLRDEWNR